MKYKNTKDEFENTLFIRGESFDFENCQVDFESLVLILLQQMSVDLSDFFLTKHWMYVRHVDTGDILEHKASMYIQDLHIRKLDWNR